MSWSGSKRHFSQLPIYSAHLAISLELKGSQYAKKTLQDQYTQTKMAIQGVEALRYLEPKIILHRIKKKKSSLMVCNFPTRKREIWNKITNDQFLLFGQAPALHSFVWWNLFTTGRKALGMPGDQGPTRKVSQPRESRWVKPHPWRYTISFSHPGSPRDPAGTAFYEISLWLALEEVFWIHLMLQSSLGGESTEVLWLLRYPYTPSSRASTLSLPVP